MEACTHPTVMWDLCAECGMDLRKLDRPNQQSASVSMVHSVPELRVSMEQAQKLGKADEDRLLDKRKLVLLVDLDQTLIHTTNDNVPNNLKDVFHFQLWGHGSVWYHTRIRPHTRQFLDNISKMFELHICTFGTRNYAYTIAHQLDPGKKLFSDRILSRDECFSQNSKTANLKELFPRGDHMVCIIDDREDVWNFAPNLIHVKPYHFFRHTGDINAPPGLSKVDQDDKTGFQFVGDKVDGSVQNLKEEKKSLEDEDSSKSEDELSNDSQPKPAPPISKAAIGEVATDLNLSEDDESDNNDPGKEEAAGDADLEESNEEDNQNQKEDKANQKEDKANQKEEQQKKQDSSVSSTTPTPMASDSSMNEEKILKEEPAVAVEEPVETATAKPTKEKEKPTSEPEVSSSEPAVEGTPEKVAAADTPDSSSNTDAPRKPEDPKVIEVEDEDDYLLYLEQILHSIHDAFYSLYDDGKRKDPGVLDVKSVIPYVRQKVLKNISIVFSGVVPTHVPLQSSKAHQIAIGLGAHVSEKIVLPPKPGSSNAESPSAHAIPTTHVVAARMGTAKVNDARRYKGIHIVTPEWLWTCAERWEHVDEKLFRLEKARNVKRNPPPHCSSPGPDFRREKFEVITPIDGPDDQMPSTSKGSQQPAMRKERTPSGRFMDTINPLLSFSAREIETMAHEVDDIFNETESSSTDDEEELQKEKERAARRRSSRSLSGQDREKTLDDPSTSELTKESLSSSSSSSSNSSDDDDDDDDGPHNPYCKRKRHHKTETETEDEPLSVKFRRGEPLPSDIDSLNLLNPSSDDDDDNEANEEDEWMAQALEREFLDENSQSHDGFDMR